jgi:hypothetical protein
VTVSAAHSLFAKGRRESVRADEAQRIDLAKMQKMILQAYLDEGRGS